MQDYEIAEDHKTKLKRMIKNLEEVSGYLFLPHLTGIGRRESAIEEMITDLKKRLADIVIHED